jgi:hypothetical protein
MMVLKSCENREYIRGQSTHPCGALVLRVSMAEVMFSTLTTWVQPVRKSRIQLQSPKLCYELGRDNGFEH